VKAARSAALQNGGDEVLRGIFIFSHYGLSLVVHHTPIVQNACRQDPPTGGSEGTRGVIDLNCGDIIAYFGDFVKRLFAIR